MVLPHEQLARKLGYTFKQPDLLLQALTHRSVSGTNNERLEFLGDAIVNFVIADALYLQFPESKEGELTRSRAKLVKGVTMAKIAKELGLGDYLHLSIGELKSGGHERESILADALEAIVGAIYLDSGFAVCQSFILAWYQSRLDDPALMTRLRDPKTKLQEYLQGEKLPLPEYEVIEITGEAHAQTFRVKCHVLGTDIITFGENTSRRGAEQQAAADFYERIQQPKK